MDGSRGSLLAVSVPGLLAGTWSCDRGTDPETSPGAKPPAATPAAESSLTAADMENLVRRSREDLGIDVILRIYVPDLEKMKTWKAPKAEQVR